MKCKRMIAAFVLAGVFFLPSPAAFSGYNVKTLKEYADESETVAKVIITGKEILFANEKGGRRHCGYKYRAEVSESFKGKSGDIVFYDDGLSYDVESSYLIFILKYEKRKKMRCPKKDKNIADGITSVDLCAIVNSNVDWACEKVRIGIPHLWWEATSQFLEGEHDGTQWITAPFGMTRDEGVRIVSYEKKLKENCNIADPCFLDLRNLVIVDENDDAVFDRLIAWKDYRPKVIEATK